MDRDGRSAATSVVKEALAQEWWQQERQRLRRELRWQERRRCAGQQCAWRLWERQWQERLLRERQQRLEWRRQEQQRREWRQQARWWRAQQRLERRRQEWWR